MWLVLVLPLLVLRPLAFRARALEEDGGCMECEGEPQAAAGN